MPIISPPFGPLGLPPGPVQHMGPNIPHSTGPLLPGVFMPPFPGPLVWPGARGVDVNMLSVPPNLPIPPPVAAGSAHNIHLNQIDTRLVPPTNVSGLGYNHMGPQSRDMLHDISGWTPHRNSGPNRKALLGGEQNDYSQNFVDTEMWPQNFIRELDLTSVAEDYPKLRELIQRKDEIIAKSASPPMYYKCDLREHVLSPEFFDHIEYWSAEEIMNLKIEVIPFSFFDFFSLMRYVAELICRKCIWNQQAIADTPSFVFLWVGDGVGLEQGRQCLKEHCLMGIKGTVRRSTDGHVIHANMDTDIIIAEEPTDGDGLNCLERIINKERNIRPGWLTLGKNLSYSNFNKEAYIRIFADKDGRAWQGGGGRNPPSEAPHHVVTTPEIEILRPKSPPGKN
ncbi:hypothetical protein U9M48_006131 [Paspalum notatum var. saurae]|uniref:Uncharacterized protein n=1 Tax=Paspalum notatum var. saurae TaxID=547442 RepID=A0AAQ3PZ18_PASNO